MKYFFIAGVMIIFVILYVWQNIEVVRMKMEYNTALQREEQLIKINDRLRYEIERYKRMELIDAYAAQSGMRALMPEDIDIIVSRKKKK